jgi:methyl-accepting chemotaxis protein
MITFFEIEERAQEVRDRMTAIVREMAEMAKPDTSKDINKALELLDEMMTLSQESRRISHNLEHHRHMAEELITSRCSGPH